MTKYKIFVKIDENKFWIITEDGQIVVKNPTKKELNLAILKIYNDTNICPICRDENFITDKSILYPKNARHEYDKNGKQTKKYVCERHGNILRRRYNSRCIRSRKRYEAKLKLNTDRRTGNLKYDRTIFGEDCEELTCRWKDVQKLS